MFYCARCSAYCAVRPRLRETGKQDLTICNDLASHQLLIQFHFWLGPCLGLGHDFSSEGIGYRILTGLHYKNAFLSHPTPCSVAG